MSLTLKLLFFCRRPVYAYSMNHTEWNTQSEKVCFEIEISDKTKNNKYVVWYFLTNNEPVIDQKQVRLL